MVDAPQLLESRSRSIATYPFRQEDGLPVQADRSQIMEQNGLLNVHSTICDQSSIDEDDACQQNEETQAAGGKCKAPRGNAADDAPKDPTAIEGQRVDRRR